MMWDFIKKTPVKVKGNDESEDFFTRWCLMADRSGDIRRKASPWHRANTSSRTRGPRLQAQLPKPLRNLLLGEGKCIGITQKCITGKGMLIHTASKDTTLEDMHKNPPKLDDMSNDT
jgi:hypothetical protein